MLYPAIKAGAVNIDRILAVVDSPTAVDESDNHVRVFFASSESRDAACRALARAGIASTSIDVDDEDWARRSQENLPPITVGRVTVVSHESPVASRVGTELARPPGPDGITIVITPSMGFGTGHHATTRLCLAALQTIDLSGKRVVDVGTGSGVLAIAAVRLGAASALGIDYDADAIHAAGENLDLNPDARGVRFETADLSAEPLSPADVVTANLTGALLARSANRLSAMLSPGGTLIVSGLMRDERDAVRAAFSDLQITWESGEDEWLAFAMKKL